MPREQRKRGKKHKAKNDALAGQVEENYQEDDYAVQEPSVIHYDQHDEDNSDPAAPFGHLDPDVKGYFRTVNDQLKQWQDEGIDTEVDTDMDPNEQRRIFFAAALSEMHNKELQLATDPECSVILERMLYSMDDFARRVFTDSLTGSWAPLITNRFASHVCQTLLTLAIDTVNREARGNVSSVLNDPEKGELLQMTQLILHNCEAILPDIIDLMRDQFASHVIRALLVLLCPSGVFTSMETHHSPSTRSKKSAHWRSKQGEMKSIIPAQSGSNSSGPVESVRPEAFMDMAKRFLNHILGTLGGNEVRALAIDKAASPLLQMFLELETYLKQADKPDSLMDHILAGLISDLHAGKELSSSAYVTTLLADSTSSHLAESLIKQCPTNIFEQIWNVYLVEDVAKRAIHPVANFVVSRAIARLSAEELTKVVERLKGTWSKCLKSSRLGPLISAFNRAGQLGASEIELLQVIRDIFELSDTTDLSLLIACVLRLKPCKEYQEALERKRQAEQEKPTDESENRGYRPHRGGDETNPLEPKIQGSLLLQAMLSLHTPHNEMVLDSLFAMEPSELLALACHPASSRIIDAVFESSTVNLRLRKKLVNAFIGQVHLLIDDRVGSRVADRLWVAADPYLKEKIARSLIPHEQFLAGSRFAKFFTRNLNLSLLKRNPDQWKSTKAKDGSSVNAIPITGPSKIPKSELKTESEIISTDAEKPEHISSKKRRKDVEPEDEIDILFSKAKRHKFSNLETSVEAKPKASTELNLDKSVLAAIEGAPRTTEKRVKSKKK
ncbi:hypothetical protein Clacol_001917 [Clathrus columnatus]|uniref:Nucleolar protein 9 n=1 Tax=Clathrus columnatus TaxID=1419009 RepID=A0AAV4ZZC7_9AGAM|nr:hypothetical protein Clacol_001917 [Clathrus columnatus]